MTPKLVLIRGLPGSGKSTLAKAMTNYVHYEADMFFIGPNGYQFDGSRLADAHAWCQKCTYISLDLGYDTVVSNTFTTRAELQPYFDMCQDFGITPLLVEARGNWPSIHNVPEITLQRMRERWEPVSFGTSDASSLVV